MLVDVVRRLDGLPLAIELAAGQLGAVPLSALHERLGRALDALSARRPTSDARHETLRATIDWSYRLLDPADRAVLRSLAPFPAGVDLETFERLSTEAAPASDPLTVLARLVDHSLVDAAQEELPRYRLLETIRTFLLDDLDARGERTEAETRFLRWASQTAAEISTAVRGEAEAAADRRLRAELANLRAARDLSRGRGDVELRIDLTLALDDAATWRDLTELWAWAVELERDPLLRGNPRENAVRASAAEASWLLGDLDGAARLAPLRDRRGRRQPRGGERLERVRGGRPLSRRPRPGRPGLGRRRCPVAAAVAVPRVRRSGPGLRRRRVRSGHAAGRRHARAGPRVEPVAPRLAPVRRR